MINRIFKNIFFRLGYVITPRRNNNKTKENKKPQRIALGYISALETITNAQKMGLSICDYVEKKYNIVGNTQNVVNQMARFGLNAYINPNVLEIGPGTGMFLEKILGNVSVNKYEIYETAEDWLDWLSKKYPIVAHHADGKTLSFTPDGTIDVLHVHGVFVYLPTLLTLHYFNEINRVTKNNALVVFDIISEGCLQGEYKKKWLNSDLLYPQILPKNFVVEVFKEFNMELVNEFKSPYGPDAVSEYLLFKKK